MRSSFAFLFVIGAITAMAVADPGHAQQTPVVKENLTYGHADGVELKLDLAHPTGTGPYPAIVFIHGGGWYQGDRQGYRSQIEEAAKRGYVAVTISYRLMQFDEAQRESASADPIFPAQIHDAKAAVRWLRKNADTYRVDPDRIGVTGSSAGGHLSLLIGLTDPEDKLEGRSGNADVSSRVQAVVNVYGPTEMKSCYETSSVAWIFRLFMGGTPDEASGTYRDASPVHYVTPDDPPVLTLHGDRDELVSVAQARLLDEAMKAAGASHELLVLEGQGHGFTGAAQRAARDAMWDFFGRHLKNQGSPSTPPGSDQRQQ